MAEIFFSCIIPTIGRPSLDFAVKSILKQDIPQAQFEIIVVNDSGSPLPGADWHIAPHVRIIDTNRCERCFARNSGAAIAKGSHLVFLDDDDWMLPGAFENFVKLADQHPDAEWLYGGIRIVDEQGMTLAEINSGLNGYCFSQMMGGAWAPIQTSMIKTSAFFQIGGFNPAIVGTEDLDLCRRIALHGKFANTPAIVACLQRGQSWDTSTDYLRATNDTRFSRDLLLSEPGAFGQLVKSARSSYWLGRNLHVYLSTVKWNIQREKYFVALSRLMHAVISLVLAGHHIFSLNFWRAVKAEHVPETLHFVIKAYNEEQP